MPSSWRLGVSRKVGWVDAEPRPGSWKAARGWVAFTFIGLAAWLGTVIVVVLRNENPADDTAPRLAISLGGAVSCTCLFGGAFVQMRRRQRREGSRLYDRLAIAPVSRATLRKMTAPMHRIGYVYLVFGAVLTGFVFVLAAPNTERLFKPLVVTGAVLLVVWLAYLRYAWSKAFKVADSVVQPLGLALTGVPEYQYSWLADRGFLVGAVTYGGHRHGRRVEITQHPELALTVVSGTGFRPTPPSSAHEMSVLTGEPHDTWRNVSVTVGDDAVIVERSLNGAGRWILQDLLLAEAIANRRTQ